MCESQLSAAHIRNGVANTLFTFVGCPSYANNSPCTVFSGGKILHNNGLTEKYQN